MKAWIVHEFGEPRDVMRLEDVAEPEPGPREVRVRVDATTLNFNDLDGVHGRYRTVAPPLPYTPGMEVMGHVDACGADAGEWLGRRVVGIPTGAFGGYAEAAICPVDMTFSMPDSIPLPDAAGIYMPFHLAFLALHERAAIQKGETVLIHAAAGGVGSAAVQLCALAGLRVIATAGSPEKLQLCRDLGADVVIDYRAGDFVEPVLDATDGRGVDVAFDTVGNEVTTSTFRCMAFNGRHLLVGFASGIDAEDEGLVMRPVLFGNFSLYGVCLAYTADPEALKRLRGVNIADRELVGEPIHKRLLNLFATQQLRAVIGLEVPFAELPDTLAAMERRETVGRIVVRLP